MARLRKHVSTNPGTVFTLEENAPVLEPNLNRSFGHVDFLGDSLPNGRGGCGVLVEFDFQSCQLVLSGSLALLVLLLLGEGALARRSSRG